jgi:hypothetical protein
MDPASEISELVKETEALQTRIQVLQVRSGPSRSLLRAPEWVPANSSPLVSLDSSKLLQTTVITSHAREKVAHGHGRQLLSGSGINDHPDLPGNGQFF